jgi:spore photoproduct lyase
LSSALLRWKIESGAQQPLRSRHKTGLLIAPVVLTENWKELYSGLIDQLSDELTAKAKKQIKIEIIFMTYSYIHRAINNEAFPKAVELYDKTIMTGRGRGKYTYNPAIRAQAKAFCVKNLPKSWAACRFYISYKSSGAYPH